MQDKSNWTLWWSDEKEKVFDNLVTLLYKKTGQHVTLIDKIFYLEIFILQEKEKCVHYEVKQILKDALHKIALKLNFCDFQLMFSFICPMCLTKGKDFLLEEASSDFYCCDYGHSIQKTSKYTSWDKVCT